MGDMLKRVTITIARRFLPIWLKKKIKLFINQLQEGPQYLDVIDRVDTMVRLLEQQQSRDSTELGTRITALEQSKVDSIERVDAMISKVEQSFKRNERELREAIKTISVEVKGRAPQSARPKRVKPGKGLRDSLLKENEYGDFQAMYRGSENQLKKKFLQHVHCLNISGKVLDVACGDGQFLELLREHNISSKGIESNPFLVQRARDKGLQIIEGDVINVICGISEGEFSTITALHFIEHLEPATLRSFLENCYGLLPEGGMLLLELPNIRSIATLTKYYFLDPTHQQPLAAETIQFVLNKIGFSNIEIEPINPTELNKQFTEMVQPSMDTLKSHPSAWEARIIEVYGENFGRMNNYFFQNGDDVVIRAYKNSDSEHEGSCHALKNN